MNPMLAQLIAMPDKQQLAVLIPIIAIAIGLANLLYYAVVGRKEAAPPMTPPKSVELQ